MYYRQFMGHTKRANLCSGATSSDCQPITSGCRPASFGHLQQAQTLRSLENVGLYQLSQRNIKQGDVCEKYIENLYFTKIGSL